ncbi:MAG: type II secretion system F family protein [Lachnospiraceae bacterium]|nr:type II secretion system F family protein [Lachnospiraceae bacterium]
MELSLSAASLPIHKNSLRKDYNEYHFSAWEYMRYLGQGLFIIAILSYIFYKSYLAGCLFLFLLPFYFKYQKKNCIEKRKNILRNQYKELLIAVLTNLQAGYSIENSFAEAYHDLSLIFHKEDDICVELTLIMRGLKNNRTLEELLDDFARRSGVAEIKEFSARFQSAKRSGGNLGDILKKCIGMIAEKMEVKQEIITIISAKKMENNIMCIIPLGIIVYVDITSPGFLNVLYHNPMGVCIMSICLGVYMFAFFLGQRIVKIEV